MTEQFEAQPDQRSTATGPGAAGPGELDQRWAEFSQARASLAEVMSDDELRDFGIDVEVLDERP